MKSFFSIFIALFLVANLANSQDTLYVYKGGTILYKSAVSGIDSISFSKTIAPAPTSTPSPTSVKDIDGNTYTTVTIGTQTWMVENLKTTKYRDGSTIQNTTDNAAWTSSTGAWCDYNNDATCGTKYGKLYNWYAVNDRRQLAPAGWHVPSIDEWNILQSYVKNHSGSSTTFAKAIAASTDWKQNSKTGTIGNNLAINNYSGFNALPAGDRYNAYGTFENAGQFCYWWASSSAYNLADYVFLTSGNSDYMVWGDVEKSQGYSVRCVKD